jgi:small-conductance mechanosensitive channel
MVGRIARARRDSGAAQVLSLAASAADVALLFFGIITALGTIGIDISALVAALGLTGFALGFALRDALSSLLAGCLILVYHPFRPGEKISVAGSEGTVVEINLRYTTLESEGKRVLVPNSVLYTNTIAIVQK